MQDAQRHAPFQDYSLESDADGDDDSDSDSSVGGVGSLAAQAQPEEWQDAVVVQEDADLIYAGEAARAQLGEEPAELKTRLQQVTRAERRRPAAAASTEIYAPAQLDLQPRPTFQARPQFPFAMRRAGVGGEVVVDFVISANGEMVNPRALKTTINPKSGGASGDTKAEPFVIAASGVESQPGAVIDGVAVAEWRRRSASRQCRR